MAKYQLARFANRKLKYYGHLLWVTNGRVDTFIPLKKSGTVGKVAHDLIFDSNVVHGATGEVMTVRENDLDALQATAESVRLVSEATWAQMTERQVRRLAE